MRIAWNSSRLMRAPFATPSASTSGAHLSIVIITCTVQSKSVGYDRRNKSQFLIFAHLPRFFGGQTDQLLRNFPAFAQGYLAGRARECQNYKLYLETNSETKLGPRAHLLASRCNTLETLGNRKSSVLLTISPLQFSTDFR
jgi:hypothetical protein